MIRSRVEGIPKSVKLAVAVTFAMVLASSGVSVLFGERLLDFGGNIITSYGRTNTDIMLYTVTAVSSSPLTLPVSAYAVIGTLLGYEPGRLITLIALGAVTGSSVSYLLGRCFGDTPFVSLILLGGAMSPVPVHPMYAACGVMRYPAALFVLIVFLGWWVRIGVVVMGIKFISDLTS
jgi:membrane protein YqaA with SNARE-associated domain